MTSHPKKNSEGDIEWRNKQGQLHRENGPAMEWADGTKAWWINGQRHRENGPAVEYANCTKYWYFNGCLHRTGGPAIEYLDGEKRWFIHDQCHRENGPAVEYADGTVEYYLHGKTGPEIEQEVKENIAAVQKKKLLANLSQNDEISAKINTSSTKTSKKL